MNSWQMFHTTYKPIACYRCKTSNGVTYRQGALYRLICLNCHAAPEGPHATTLEEATTLWAVQQITMQMEGVE